MVAAIAVWLCACSALNLQVASPRVGPVRMKVATRPSKGFAAKPKKAKRKAAPIVKLEPDVEAAMEVLGQGEQSLEAYLNPKHFEDPPVSYTHLTLPTICSV